MSPRKSRRSKRVFFTVATIVALLTFWAVIQDSRPSDKGNPMVVVLPLLIVSLAGLFLAWKRTDASGKIVWRKKK